MSLENTKIEISKAFNFRLLKTHQEIKDKINILLQEECDMDLEDFISVYNTLLKPELYDLDDFKEWLLDNHSVDVQTTEYNNGNNYGWHYQILVNSEDYYVSSDVSDGDSEDEALRKGLIKALDYINNETEE